MDNETAYKVLKDWGDHKAGEIFSSAELAEADAIEGLIADGTIEVVEPVAPEAKPDQAATDAQAAAGAAATNVPAEPAPAPAPKTTPEAGPAAPDLAKQQTDKVQPVAQGILEDMTTMLIPEDGVSFNMDALELATIKRFLDADLNITTDVPLAFQYVVSGLTGLSQVLAHCAYPEPHTQVDYAEAARAVLAIIAKANAELGDTATAAQSLQAAKADLEALFADKNMSAIDVRYIVNSIMQSFQSLQLGTEKSIEESMSRAQAKAFGVGDVIDVTMGKLDAFLNA
ncbi:hypothetical protein JJE66_33785 [Bradyrhizobium diazoefficiens]|uniref:hypothetical protein n=1 Tax=Bradyrhizobium diazoefficiens TaxID=1355477 RepID=UPI001909D1B6|nr:hypothetical protein [Bradyrhizobium diazoefficiens]MBK3666180.1 hypothetical protein [Bradyrhizobium diazoefficiens]